MCDRITDRKDFELWAFGASPVSYCHSTMLAWNSRHGDVYRATDSEYIKDSVQKMYEIYKQMKREKEEEQL